jgi:hypothetical protein
MAKLQARRKITPGGAPAWIDAIGTPVIRRKKRLTLPGRGKKNVCETSNGLLLDSWEGSLAFSSRSRREFKQTKSTIMNGFKPLLSGVQMRKPSVIVSKTLFPLALVYLLFCSSVLIAHADNDKSREESVLKFEHEWSDTWLKSDVKAMDRLLTADFVEVAPDGSISSRAEHLAGFSSGKLKFQAMDFSDMKVRFYGNVAVVTGFVMVKSSYEGKDNSGKFAFTDVLVFHDGGLKAASTQATKVGP